MNDFPEDLDSPLGVCASLSYPTPQGSDVSWRQMQPDSYKRARPRPFCLALSVGRKGIWFGLNPHRGTC